MNNKTFRTSNTINEDYMLFPYNDQYYSSQHLLPLTPSSFTNDILIQSISNTSHNHQFLQAPSSFSEFDFGPDLAFLISSSPQNNGHHDHNQTITTSDYHLLHLNNPIGESQLVEPSETITSHIEDPQKISTFQEPKMKKVKKPSRTDRHSKIKTAKGTRDRRMRLSLDVAKELFGLQDMLGFDKASKTVEWLLTQAKPEIIKMATTLSTNKFNHVDSFSSGEESQTRPVLGSMHTSSDLCELASMWTVDDRGSNTNTTEITNSSETRGNKVDERSMRGKRKMSQPRTPINKTLSKDARAKARERAKDRTKEKMMMKTRSQVVELQEEAHNHCDEVVKNNKSYVNWNPLEVTPCQELCKNDDDRFASFNDFVVDQKYQISNESYDMTNQLNSSLYPMLNHHRSQGAASSIEQHHHQYQFTDIHHILGKPRNLMYKLP